MFDREPDQDIIRRAAESLVRQRVRDGLTAAVGDVIDEGLDRANFIDLATDSVCGQLGRRDTAWALAYIAGVQMAPALLGAIRQSSAPMESEVGND